MMIRVACSTAVDNNVLDVTNRIVLLQLFYTNFMEMTSRIVQKPQYVMVFGLENNPGYFTRV